jgi:hypothetical protein
MTHLRLLDRRIIDDPDRGLHVSREFIAGSVVTDQSDIDLRPHRIKLNLMGVGGLRTYVSFTRIGGQPSIDHVFEGLSIMKSFPFLPGNKSIAAAVFIVNG